MKDVRADLADWLELEIRLINEQSSNLTRLLAICARKSHPIEAQNITIVRLGMIAEELDNRAKRLRELAEITTKLSEGE